jgi:hypothetical protein
MTINVEKSTNRTTDNTIACDERFLIFIWLWVTSRSVAGKSEMDLESTL